MLVSVCGICGKKKSRFIKDKKVSGHLRKLGSGSPISEIPLFVISYFILRQKTIVLF